MVDWKDVMKYVLAPLKIYLTPKAEKSRPTEIEHKNGNKSVFCYYFFE